MDDHVGKQFGDYGLIRRLGGGQFGDVYLGEHIRDKTQVAVKVLHAILTNEEDIENFINEIRALFRLQHYNIVPLRDFGIKQKLPFIVMAYTPNGTLRRPSGTRFPLAIIVEFVKQIAEALQYAHEQGIIHRDVKPDNILLSPKLQVWLSDFGIAGVAHSTVSGVEQKMAGTLPYMAPEQIERRTRSASDQYALGVIVYEWLCGSRPFVGDEVQLIHQHLKVDPPSLHEQVPTIPSEVEQVILTALAKDPKQRFGSVRAFANALEQAAAPNRKITSRIESERNNSLKPKTEHVNPVAEAKDANALASIPIPIPSASLQTAVVPSENNENKSWDEPTPIEPILALGGAGIVAASLTDDNDWLQPSPTSQSDASSPVPSVIPPSGDEGAKPISRRPRSEPIPIVVPLQTEATTKPLSPGTIGVNAAASPPVRSSSTGKQAVVGAAAVGAGAAAFAATGHAPVSGGAPPSTRGIAGRGRSRRSTRQLLAILLVIIMLLLLAGIAFASPMGQSLIGHITGSTVTTTLIITPKHPKVTDSFVVTAITGTPDPEAHQVKARILSYTSPSGSGSANAAGSIQGANATGTLTFSNIGNGVQISGGTLSGANGVSISFGSFFLPFGSVTIQGTAVNQGASGNIPALDINGSCCNDSNIRVRNPGAFSGGRDPITNAIITQNDINSASNKLVSSLTPAAQTALQQQVQAGEQVVSGSLKCTPNNLSSNQHVGDQAKSVTVTCKEEVYDQKGALSIGVGALKAEAAQSLGAHYVLVGNVVASVRPPTTIDGKGSISPVVDAAGQWVYHFTGADLTVLKNKLAKESQSTAQTDVQKTAGVENAAIKISSGTTIPDAANITITIESFPGVSITPTPTSSTTPTGSPAITPTSGLGNGQTVTPTPVLGGS